ncbi:uncharacterized protein DUF1573 [Marinoscillum furvescens DSM 4134]|uniref:Uncharacterized protein DUF1573 n=2 Tax=Marinoscillum furvescens TaxID=1026 RepID=A0A3D9KZP4_MARFU|nr:uncharacterized protein DUF1573 [Marinoscillum furvescens DSM 4134]
MCCMLLITRVWSQAVEFIKTTHDFGEVKEEGGAISYTFQFVNQGDEPVQVTGVKASCGCTTPDWTREAVSPGDTGKIVAQYNPYNRPGKFKKSLSMNYKTGEISDGATLYIEGIVQPKPKTIEDELPTRIGAIRLQYKALNLGKITNESVVKKSFQVYNESDSVVIFQVDKSKIPAHVRVQFSPDTLPPKTLGALDLIFDPVLKDDLGFVTDELRLVTDEPEDSIKDLTVMATIQEYFPPMSDEELALAPRLAFDRTQHDYGRVTQGNAVATTFELTNTGKQSLKIRKVKTNCDCAVGELETNELAPGESAQLEVTFDTSGRRGRQYKTITVFSNDPTASTQMISVKAIVD